MMNSEFGNFLKYKSSININFGFPPLRGKMNSARGLVNKFKQFKKFRHSWLDNPINQIQNDG